MGDPVGDTVGDTEGGPVDTRDVGSCVINVGDGVVGDGVSLIVGSAVAGISPTEGAMVGLEVMATGAAVRLIDVGSLLVGISVVGVKVGDNVGYSVDAMVGVDVGAFVEKTVGDALVSMSESVVGAMVGDAVGHAVMDCSIATDVTDGKCCCNAATRFSESKASETIGCKSRGVGILTEVSLK